MEATEATLRQLRAWTGERIPEGGTEADTRFTNAQLAEIVESYDWLEAAAAEVWRTKAGMAIEEGTGALEKQIGTEKLKFLGPVDRQKFYLRMADLYDSYVTEGAGGSRVMEQVPLDVLGLARFPVERDLSRLIGY